MTITRVVPLGAESFCTVERYNDIFMKVAAWAWKDAQVYDEIILLARSRAFRPRKTSRKRLMAEQLVDALGVMPDDVRAVVLAIIPEHGFDRRLTPIAAIDIEQ